MSIKKIDEGLAKYYKLHGRDDYFNGDGVGKFFASCDENGFVDDDVADDLEASADECMLLDFDDNFPGVKSGDLEAIFAIIKKCNAEGKDAYATFVETEEKDETTMKYTKKKIS
eukprot:530574_1